MDQVDRARQLAESISCIMNVLAPLVWPERFGELPEEHRARAVAHVAQLRAALALDLGNVQSDANLAALAALLPEVEQALTEPSDRKQLARVAGKFFAALNVDPRAVGLLP